MKNILPETSFSEKPSQATSEKDNLIPTSEIKKQENSTDLKEGTGQKYLEKPLKLTINVKNNSWFNLSIDGLQAEDFLLAAGEEKHYWGNKVFRLTIGNKQGTNLILNGKRLVLPESKENVINRPRQNKEM